MFRKLILTALAMVLVMAPAAFAQDDAPVIEPLDPPETVTVAYVPIMKFAAMYVAEERGLFDKYGLDVQIERVASGTEAIAFLTEGQIDIGGIAIVTSLWNGWNEGLDIRIIAPGALEPFENSPTKLIARADSGIESIEDLAGATIAIAGGPGSGGEYLLSKAIEPAGLTIFDINAVNIGNPDMPAAFENGSIDAGILGSPFADQVIDAGNGVAIAEDFVPGLMTVAFVGSGQFVTERPEVAQRFALALMEASRMMQGDDYLSDENIAAYLAYTNSTEEALRGGTPVIYDPNQVLPVEGLADVERIHRENGRTGYEEPINLENVVITEFTDTARELLGEIEADFMMDDEAADDEIEEPEETEEASS